MLICQKSLSLLLRPILSSDLFRLLLRCYAMLCYVLYRTIIEIKTIIPVMSCGIYVLQTLSFAKLQNILIFSGEFNAVVILNFQISQGSVATKSRQGGNLYEYDRHIESFLVNPRMKEFWRRNFCQRLFDMSVQKMQKRVFGRPYYRSSLWYSVSSVVCCLSVVCLSSVTFCIVAKRCILAKKCLKE